MLTRKCDICGAEMRITTPRYKVTFNGWLYTEEKDICIDCFKRIADEIKRADTPQTETKTETQKSNLSFEKDECAKEYEELGLKELKELIEAERKTESNSEIPNNCEHITEDGVTCAKYPACDDCLDYPLNKVKGSERLLKGKTEPQMERPCNKCEWYQKYGKCVFDYCHYEYEQAHKDEPQTDGYMTAEQAEDYRKMLNKAEHKVYGNIEDEPQTDTEIAKAIVHKMIDDAVIAEDAYPNLRQKMHDAVDEYEPHIVGKHADVVIIDDSRLTAKCLNCNNSKACKEKHWDGCVYEPIEDDPQVVMPKKCKGCDSASKIIEAYSRGFEDGAEAVKAMPQTERSE